MTFALKLAIDFGLNHIRLKRIIATTSENNSKAINLLDRLGFVKSKDYQTEVVEYEYSLKNNFSTF